MIFDIAVKMKQKDRGFIAIVESPTPEQAEDVIRKLVKYETPELEIEKLIIKPSFLNLTK